MSDGSAEPGRLITFEGGEGAGKSVQVARLAADLRDQGRAVIETREPGGTPGAEAIRSLLVTGAVDRWDALTELLLLSAARRDHVRQIIRPALAAGTWVLCDRFFDSTMAYQGYAGGLGRDVVARLTDLAVDGLRPDLTVILDVPVDIGLARAAARPATGAARYEALDTAFHDAVRAAFLDIARREPERCVVVDATQPPDAVAAAIRTAVNDALAAA